MRPLAFTTALLAPLRLCEQQEHAGCEPPKTGGL